MGVNCYAVLFFALFAHILFFHIFTVKLADGIIDSRGVEVKRLIDSSHKIDYYGMGIASVGSINAGY